MTTQEHQLDPTALIWWSINKICWICQIGNNITHHYSEQGAIAYGELLVSQVCLASAVQLEGNLP